jgi:hypothetical protein
VVQLSPGFEDCVEKRICLRSPTKRALQQIYKDYTEMKTDAATKPVGQQIFAGSTFESHSS